MNFGLLFFQFLPLILYIAVDYWKGFKAGIAAAIAACIFMVGWELATSGAIDPMSLGEAILVVALGAISLKMNNERFFKFQPTVVALIVAGVFASFELRGEHLMIRYIPQMERLFTSDEPASPTVQQFIANLHQPEFQKLFADLSRFMVILFLGHAVIMAYAALHWSTNRWFAWRLAIYPALLLSVFAVKILNTIGIL